MNLIANNITDVFRLVARIVHYLQKHFVGRTLATVKAQHDENVFGKVGTSAAEFEKALRGKKVLSARQQGKYFWYDISGRFFLSIFPTYRRAFTQNSLRVSNIHFSIFLIAEGKMELRLFSYSPSFLTWFYSISCMER